MPLQVNQSALDRIVESALQTASCPLPRLAAIVASEDEILWSGAGGKQQYASDGSASGQVTIETPFSMFSSTKFVTCLCALQMLDAGYMKLDDHAETWIPELRGKRILTGYSENGQEQYEEPTSKVTIRDLFRHTGGLPYTPGKPIFERYRKEHGLEKQVEGLKGERSAYADIPHNFTPGSRVDYSTGIDHLGYVIEAITGLDLEEYTQKKLFDPLGIKDGVYRRSPEYMEKEVNLVYPRKTEDGTTIFEPAPFTLATNPISCGGGGGLHISCASFIKLLQVLLNKGVHAPTGAHIFSPEAVDLFFAPQVTNDEGTKYGPQVKEWLHLNADPFHRSKSNGGDDASAVPHRRRGWGLGGGLNLEGLKGGRNAGTMFASGFGDTYCWIDRSAGVCASFMVNTAPSTAPGVYEFWQAWETEIYASLKEQK